MIGPMDKPKRIPYVVNYTHSQRIIDIYFDISIGKQYSFGDDRWMELIDQDKMNLLRELKTQMGEFGGVGIYLLIDCIQVSIRVNRFYDAEDVLIHTHRVLRSIFGTNIVYEGEKWNDEILEAMKERESDE